MKMLFKLSFFFFLARWRSFLASEKKKVWLPLNHLAFCSRSDGNEAICAQDCLLL